MLLPVSGQDIGVSAPPGDFDGNYRSLKKMINKALREGTPIQDLHPIPKDRSHPIPSFLSREDLLKLLRVIRKIRSCCQELLRSPVPPELERDILAKNPEDRLPWEEEALEKAERWHEDVKSSRARVRKMLNDYLNSEFFLTK
ncbi:MAG: hypothetical protein V2B18_23865 [Pseudomonadota bacterium]